jgi:hypothetical protein
MRGWAAGIYDQSRLAPYAAKTLTTHFTPDKNGNIVHKFGALNYIEAGYGGNAAQVLIQPLVHRRAIAIQPWF